MISSAADLMYVRGVNAVALDDVRAATGTSKSQLYKHFPDGKPELVRAVVALRAEQILAREEQRLERLKSMSGLRRWRDALVQGAALQGGALRLRAGQLGGGAFRSRRAGTHLAVGALRDLGRAAGCRISAHARRRDPFRQG